MSICIRYTKREDEAILVLNDGFLKVFGNITRFDTERPFKPWFRRILVNSAINYVKKQEKFKKQVSMEEAGHISIAEDILSRLSYRELMQMVQSLSAAYRTVFNLYVIDGFKHEEIAQMLGISIGASKSNLFKARAKLQDMIEESLRTKLV